MRAFKQNVEGQAKFKQKDNISFNHYINWNDAYA